MLKQTQASTLEWLEQKRNHQASNSMHQLHLHTSEYTLRDIKLARNTRVHMYVCPYECVHAYKLDGWCLNRGRENRFQEEAIVT